MTSIDPAPTASNCRSVSSLFAQSDPIRSKRFTPLEEACSDHLHRNVLPPRPYAHAARCTHWPRADLPALPDGDAAGEWTSCYLKAASTEEYISRMGSIAPLGAGTSRHAGESSPRSRSIPLSFPTLLTRPPVDQLTLAFTPPGIGHNPSPEA